MHADVTNTIFRVKYCCEGAVEWARWVGFTAMKQHDKDHTCDHDAKADTFSKANGTLHTRPLLPNEATIIRRFPWVARSLGTVEHRRLQAENTVPGFDTDVIRMM